MSFRRALLLMVVGFALAQGPARAQNVARRAVVYVMPSDAPADLRPAIAAQIGDLGATAIWERSDEHDLRTRLAKAAEFARRHHAAAILWLDLAADGSDLLMQVIEPDQVRTYVRRLVVPKGHPMTAIVEEVSLVTRELTSAVIEGRRVQMEPVLPPSPPARLRVALSYAGSALNGTTPWQQQPELDVDLQLRSGVMVGVGYARGFPVMLSSGATEVRTDAHIARVRAGFGRAHRRLWLGALAQGLLAAIPRTTQSLPNGQIATDPTTGFDAGGGLAARIEFALTRRISLFVEAGADVLVRRTTYEPASGTGPSITPWRVRPHGGAGLALWPW